MKKPNYNLNLPAGNISLGSELGKYYQDFTQAIIHFDDKYFGDFDENGIPMCGFGKEATYNQIYIIQYGLILHDLIQKGIEVEQYSLKLKNCVEWMEKNEEETGDSIVWRNWYYDERYKLKSGWASGMYQGQAISLYLRYGQMIGKEDIYIEKAKRIYNFFQITYEDGGVRRTDSQNHLWFEEYPSDSPSFVLNGFIYTLFGFYDVWRVTKDPNVKLLIDECLNTLRNSLHLYDSGYWSVYDQLKKELATKYYHKNIHIPLMEILYGLTQEEIFLQYKKRWEKQLNSKINNIFVEVMYRVKPRLQL